MGMLGRKAFADQLRSNFGSGSHVVRASGSNNRGPAPVGTGGCGEVALDSTAGRPLSRALLGSVAAEGEDRTGRFVLLGALAAGANVAGG